MKKFKKLFSQFYYTKTKKSRNNTMENTTIIAGKLFIKNKLFQRNP